MLQALLTPPLKFIRFKRQWKTLTLGECLLEPRSLISSKETPYFILSIIVSVFIYLIAVVSVIGIGIALLILGFVLFSNALMIGNLRGNGVRISERQFPEVYERVVHLSKAMNLKTVPDVFVIHSEGAFNAFATRFLGRNMVVIYSEVFELAREKGDKELDFIIAHELAHIKRRHIWKSILVMPANFMPFLSQAYSRACEYTCDQKAAYYIQDGAAAKRALTILSIGKVLYKDINETEFLEQIHSESNVAVWFAELLSTHPILPKRIQAVGQFMQISDTPNFRPDTGKIAIGAIISGAVFFVLYIGMIVFLVFSVGIFSAFLPDDVGGGYSDEVDQSESPDGTTALMQAASYGDTNKVEKLINEGEDIHAYDGESTTALHYAVYNDEMETAKLLLEKGADPNDSDDYSTALITSLINESYDIAALLYSFGANPNDKDSYGSSALSYVEVNTVTEFEDFLMDPY